MSVVVFGPLTLEGVTLSPRERAVLSALVLRAGRPVTTDELADALWGDQPPETWPKQLQASIGRLRNAIGRNAIETTPGAYILRIDPDTVDAERFERLAASARRHLDDDPARALDAVERALELWRGTPYADLASWTPAVVEAERLEEVRMELEEARVDAHLRLGEDAAFVADAERLVRVAPLRERRWVLLATALYRSGRQADALAAIRAARERLAEELGAEPGAELSELELGILRHDDALDLGDAPASPSAACPYRGLQPFGVEDEENFFGREADIDAALARLGTSRFLAVSGASGSGKSSLVRAGVVPALQRRGDRVVILTPEHDLDARIREAVWSGRADVVVVDQFEEVFHAVRPTSTRPPARSQRFLLRVRPSSSSCAPTSSTTAPVTPTSRPSSPRAYISSARWRPPRCARPSSSPPGAPGCDSSPGWWRSSSGMPRARPAHFPISRTHSWRRGSDGRARRSRLPAMRHPAAFRARSRSRPTASTSRWIPASA